MLVKKRDNEMQDLGYWKNCVIENRTKTEKHKSMSCDVG